MTLLLLGLVVFLGVHCIRIVADSWRTRMLSSLGEARWKGLYSVASLAGFSLLCWGYASARGDLTVLWSPPIALKHLTLLLMWLSWVLLVAAYVPGNSVQARVHHPMLLGVLLWSLAHLLANGRLVQVLLFGSFALWSLLCLRSCWQRDQASGKVYASGRALPTVLVWVAGTVLYAVFLLWGHRWVTGVAPLP